MNRFVLVLMGLMFSSVCVAQDYVIWSGGITRAERNNAPLTGTKLEFFVSGGNYLADITVKISDGTDREIVNTMVKGPWLILDLPEGRYTVLAERRNGDQQSVVIQVGQNGNAEIGIMFPES